MSLTYEQIRNKLVEISEIQEVYQFGVARSTDLTPFLVISKYRETEKTFTEIIWNIAIYGDKEHDFDYLDLIKDKIIEYTEDGIDEFEFEYSGLFDEFRDYDLDKNVKIISFKTIGG